MRKLLLAFTFVCLAISSAAPVPAQTVSVSQFSSIEVQDGGVVILRHGPKHQVTLVKGSADYSKIKTDDRGVLIIEKCKSRCPRGYALEVEVVSPSFESLTVNDGGTIRTAGSFPRAERLSVAVANGGVIDTRSIIANNVSASVREGGAIFTRAELSMKASVFNGGAITYWGKAEVKTSVEGGGVVSKGAMTDLNKPLSEFNGSLSQLPAVPPPPAVPAIRN